MGKINILFFSALPITIRAVENLLRNNSDIQISSICYSRLADFFCAEYERSNVVLFDDSALTPEELSIITDFILTNNIKRKRILFTARRDKYYIESFIRGGVDGIISKRSDPEKIKEGLQQIISGGKFIDAEITEYYNYDRKENGELPQVLTNREREICSHLAEGMGNKEIADKLFISNRTVEAHKFNVMKKFDLKSSRELLIFATKHFGGLLLLAYSWLNLDALM